MFVSSDPFKLRLCVTATCMEIIVYNGHKLCEYSFRSDFFTAKLSIHCRIIIILVVTNSAGTEKVRVCV